MEKSKGSQNNLTGLLLEDDKGLQKALRFCYVAYTTPRISNVGACARQNFLRMTCSWLYLNQETTNSSKFCQPVLGQDLLRLACWWLYISQETANRSKFCQPILWQNLLRISKQPIAANFANRFLGNCCDRSWVYLSHETVNRSKFCPRILGQDLLRLTCFGGPKKSR